MGATTAAVDATAATNASSSKVVIKAAKKALKRQDSGSMKMKHLAKSLLEKEDVPSCKHTVRKWIEESDVFEVDGKIVTLKKSSKKRKSIEDSSSADAETSDNVGSSMDDRKAAKKAAKKAKKDKKNKLSPTSSSSSADNVASIEEWRKQHKIVLRDSRNGKEGAAATKLLVADAMYYPFQTFDAPKCVEKIASSLIRQCTEVNGFQTPSPIQAQCWVSGT